LTNDSTDRERRSRLLSIKLRALVREHLGLSSEPEGRAEVFGLGAAFVTPSETWVYVDGAAQRALGPTLAWFVTQMQSGMAPAGAPLNLVVERDSGLLVRRAAMFDLPIHVWHVNERLLLPAVREEHLPLIPPHPRHLEFVPMIERAGADVVVEHGIVVGEVLGLEICRVVDDVETGEMRLEVGMGAHDREAFALIHGHLPTEDALRSVIDTVAQHRQTGARIHPLNTFGAERLLRAQCIAQPEMVGLSFLEPAEPPIVRTNLKDAVPCVARGHDGAGDNAAVTFMHGVDLDVIPFALDAADRLGDNVRIIVAARDKDVVPSIMKMGVLAYRPIELRLLAH
jgi:hypothetical protein